MATEPSAHPEIITFYGECHAVRLVERDASGHVLIEILTGDDGEWFISEKKNAALSSYWLPELIGLLAQAQAWMQNACTPDLSGDRQYGYKTLTPQEK